MKLTTSAIVLALFGMIVGPSASASPVIPALANKHPLSSAEVGELLIGELRCLACHTRKDAPSTLQRAAPDLRDVGSRVSPDFLKKFVASPSATHAGSTMPDILSTESPERREKIAEAITHFLIAQSPRRFQSEKILEADATVGKGLFHTVGCVACHSPHDNAGKEITREGVIALGHVTAKYSVGSLGEFLYQPLKVRPSGRMPDMKLTASEARAIASYLLGKTDTAVHVLQPDENLVALGKTLFQQFNCASCHKLGDVSASAPISDLRTTDPMQGCLSNTVGKNPHFHLSEVQTTSIRAALAQKPVPITDKILLAKSLMAFNCIACHVRDDYGGVTEERNPHFQTSEKNLGDEARIPPPLTLVGAKLQPVALQKMLLDGDSVRPYMYTRMPQFGEPNVRHLPELFAKLDSVKKVEFSMPNPERGSQKERDREKELRAAGRELLGNKGLTCVTCHTFNGKSVSMKGIDLMTVTQRLQPGWYYQYMLDPSAFRPRAVMPSSWPRGRAVLTTVLHGDTRQQLEAIWYYLSLGTSAADPPGVERIDTILKVGRETRTYRGRSSVAGYRGIAVGYPEKLNYAWNAETGTLSAIWRGDFVRVDRGGQGSGGFNPASRHVALAQDLSFFKLADENAPWPLRPVMTKDQKTNPDPLYPKSHGYQFRGYELDDASIPTFQYRLDNLEIEDRSTVDSANKKHRLVRKLTFSAPKSQIIWFRALTGQVEAESMTTFKIPELRLTIPDGPTLLRATIHDKVPRELLLKFDIPAGSSTRVLTYELLP